MTKLSGVEQEKITTSDDGFGMLTESELKERLRDSDLSEQDAKEIRLELAVRSWKASQDDVPLLADPDRLDAILRAIKSVAEQCDGAKALDRRGFSRFHTAHGHTLARKTALTPCEAAFGRHLVRKHRRQVPFPILAEIYGDQRFADLEPKRQGEDLDDE